MSSVAVRIETKRIICAGSEAMQGLKIRAIGADGEHRAIARTAAIFRRPIQRVAQ